MSAGSVEMVSNAALRPSLDALGQIEQLRYAIAELTGNPHLAFDPALRLLITQSVGPESEIRKGRSRLVLRLAPNTAVSPDAFYAAARELLDHSAASLPGDFASGMAVFLSTVQVRGAHIVWGAPPPPGQRTLAWARVHLLATQPSYYGKLRVILFNLQKGVAPDPAFRNATGKSAAEFDLEAERYLKAGIFTTADAPSRTLNAQRDWKTVALTEEDGRLALADLLDGNSAALYQALIASKSHMAECYDGLGQLALKSRNQPLALENFARAVELESKDASLWLSYAKVETDRVKAGDAIEHALQLEPENAEAHYLLGIRKDDPLQLELATSLAPRRWEYWDALATAYLDQNRFADATKAWRSAAQNAPEEAVRARMERRWREMETSRLNYEASERRRTEDEQRAKTEALKNAATTQLRAAEARVNGSAGSPAATGEAAPVPWDEVMPVELNGSLTLVECLGTRTRVTIAPSDGPAVKLMLKSRKGLTCGSTPGKLVHVEYLARPDSKLGTVGEAEKLS